MSFLYVAQSVGGVIKVGRTERPNDRISGLRSMFKLVGHDMRRISFTSRCVTPWVAEKRLLNSLHAQGLPQLMGREWFSHGDFDSLIQTAQVICDSVNWQNGARAREREERIAAKQAARDAKARAELEQYLMLQAHFFAVFQQWQQEGKKQ